MLNGFNDGQLIDLVKHLNGLERYKILLSIDIQLRPKTTDKDYSIKKAEICEAKIKNHQNIIANVEYLKNKLR